MDKEVVRLALNRFLKMYYEEINFKEITGKQFKYLKLIRKHEKSTYSELAELFCISKPTLTETINRFLKAGLVAAVSERALIILLPILMSLAQ